MTIRASMRGFVFLLLLAVAVVFGGAEASSSNPPKVKDAVAAPFRPVRETIVDWNDVIISPNHYRSQHRWILRQQRSSRDGKDLTASIRGGVVENTTVNAVAGSVAMALIEKVVKEVFKANDISFPSQLGACIALFAFLLISEAVSPDFANSVFGALSPGAALLAKWLPVFFVPGLAMLPLAPSIGDTSEVRSIAFFKESMCCNSGDTESMCLSMLPRHSLILCLAVRPTMLQVLKVLAVVGLGFVYSLTTTTFSVLVLRKAQGSLVTSAIASKSASASGGKGSAPPKPFSDRTMDVLLKGTVAFGAASLLAIKADASGDLVTPLRTLFLGFGTVAAYVWGARLPNGFTKLVHPLVTSCVILLVLVRLFAAATGTDFLDVLRTYKVGSLDPTKTGAGDVLLYLLGPSVVSFAISMYSRRALLKSNLLVVVLSMLVSSVGGLFGTAAFVRAISLGGSDGDVVRLSVLPRNVTTALAMALTSMIGGNLAITASVVVLTGILGATYGKTILTSMGVYDPVCRGLGIGASSQGLGVASISDEPDAFPFAAISMVLTAMCATTLVSVPAIKDILIQLATGAAVE